MGVRDPLSNLYTYNEFKRQYYKKIKEWNRPMVIAIDFTNFKYVNDNFGHKIGDICIKLFGRFAREVFPSQVLGRRSGDEFLFLVNLTRGEIENGLESIQKRIDHAFQKREIPLSFHFNSGVIACTDDFDRTLENADVTMYHAKLNKKAIQYFDVNIYEEKKEVEHYFQRIDDVIASHHFYYISEPIYDQNRRIRMNQIDRRDQFGKSLYPPKYKNLLLQNFIYKRIDLDTISKILSAHLSARLEKQDSIPVLIHLHYQTLFAKERDVVGEIKDALIKRKLNLGNVILSIHIPKREEELENLKIKLQALHKIGVQLCLESFEKNTTSFLFDILEEVEISYVIFKKEALERSMQFEKNYIFAQKMLELLKEFQIVPIFEKIDTEEEFCFLRDLSEDGYMMGTYFEKGTLPVKYF